MAVRDYTCATWLNLPNGKDRYQFVKLDCCVHTVLFTALPLGIKRNPSAGLVRLTHNPVLSVNGVCSPISRCMSLDQLMNGAFCCQLLLLALIGQTDPTLLISSVWKLKVIRAELVVKSEDGPRRSRLSNLTLKKGPIQLQHWLKFSNAVNKPWRCQKQVTHTNHKLQEPKVTSFIVI